MRQLIFQSQPQLSAATGKRQESALRDNAEVPQLIARGRSKRSQKSTPHQASPSSRQAMGGQSETFKPMLQLVSAVVGAALFALSCAGFDHVAKTSSADFEGQTSFGCICFLGCCFGVLLALAELNWGLFYFFFGFLRYRLGRAIIFAIAGIMMGLIGKNLDDQCRCKTYVILIVEGVACVGMAAVHLLAIFVYGNNTKPMIPPNTGAAGGAGYVLPPLPKQAPRLAARTNAADSATLQPVVVVVEPPVPQPTARNSNANANQPSWMNA